MRVLPNRTFRARDDWRAILNARADARRTARCRCRECGFVAFRALEHCPVCGQWDWPFDPVRRTPGDARTPHAVQRFDTWSSRVTRTLRNAAFRRPRASSAPILSILTLVLLVGGYVMVDRACNADPVCRGSKISGAATSDAGAYVSNDPVLPVLPAPAYPFHSTDGTQVAAARQRSPDVGEAAGRTTVARAAPANRAPDRPHAAATVRVADLKAGRNAAHRARVFHRVSAHTAHTARARRTTTASNTQLAQLYRGH
ncbi:MULTISPECIES: hypothetical protein [Burkholderia]|uniref:hypothetical protein n=1 Tax=Burkholderia TaxID=32008 RepID=UPI00064F86EE|nr:MULTISPECIES: hypothetical protein [Burkholderia]KML02848.1 hypothetical protein VL00_30980 [Burkholderia cepacia]KML35906.1 hypothetical protein VL13_29735 [Burkholderia lata]KMN60796.1 hypothetical protein VK92_09615 [Burkholderia sp. LK4]